ncbi:tautomerase family protein [Streptomyces sp. NBC_00859]|uniref:tautomerase family protein n=1 Tax=Streptomyces sp. NBC_00859 TaxID=2903682 RepID=UPI003866C95E|nr:tautomerase family protein [Streptomyces sp. NBC_00859]
MPLVRIDVLGCDTERLAALGRAVQEALTETMGFPDDDRFQILTGHDGERSLLHHGTYLGVQRDDGIVYVSITLRAGRPASQKQELYRRIAELAQEYADTEPRNVFVALTENTDADWSLGYGEAQYLDLGQSRPADRVAAPPAPMR